MVFEKKVFVLQYLQNEQDNCGVAAGSSVRWVVEVSKTAHNVITVPVLVARSLLETWPLIHRQNPPSLPPEPATTAKKHCATAARHLIIMLTLTTQTKTLLIQPI